MVHTIKKKFLQVPNKQQNFLEPAIIGKFMAWLAGFAQISLMEMDYNVFGKPGLCKYGTRGRYVYENRYIGFFIF